LETVAREEQLSVLTEVVEEPLSCPAEVVEVLHDL
jgi:hypothetical protein